MKNMNCHKLVIITVVFLGAFFPALPQDSSGNELLANIGYYVEANEMPYLIIDTKTKVERRIQPVSAISFKIYLDSIENFIAKGTTGRDGKARVDLPASLKEEWNASARHEFILKTDATKSFDESTSTLSITKTKLSIDTVTGSATRTIRVRMLQSNGNQWLPAGNVELKIGVKRFGGVLPLGEEETYTTDSTGEVTAEFTGTKLPGDSAGNIVLVAKVESNELFGNVATEVKLPWGLAGKTANAFGERTLWATRDKAPVWLIIAAAGIMIIVWGTIVFLLLQLLKIRRLGVSGR